MFERARLMGVNLSNANIIMDRYLLTALGIVTFSVF